MKKHLLDYNLKVRLPIIVFAAVLAFTVTYYASYAERNGIGYSPEQPIKFSHKLHAGDMQIDCKYCHVGVEKSRVASVPSADICMNCHTVARADRPEIVKLVKY
ncbi:MAG: cytochrome c3 family protein, partial [Ignavibacteria bacterium]